MVDGRDTVSPKIGLLRRNAVRAAHECDDIESGANELSCRDVRCLLGAVESLIDGRVHPGFLPYPPRYRSQPRAGIPPRHGSWMSLAIRAQRCRSLPAPGRSRVDRYPLRARRALARGLSGAQCETTHRVVAWLASRSAQTGGAADLQGFAVGKHPFELHCTARSGERPAPATTGPGACGSGRSVAHARRHRDT